VARIAFVSFRLGGNDGVSIEAQKWKDALLSLGHEVIEVAGEGPVDVVIPGLTMAATAPPTLTELTKVFEGVDLVIVENVASLPLNVAAREVLYSVLEGRRVIFRHHDLAWQREHLAHLDGPRDAPGWYHVTINDLSREDLRERGIEAVTMRNTFDCDPPRGRRARARDELGVDDQYVLLLASRALERKNIAGALRLAHGLDAVLWILGPSEDGYEETLETLLETSTVDVRRGLNPELTVHDAYAACDLVVMPSTWEGFGNPVLESVTHRRPLALYPYPVAREIMRFGFTFFDLEDVAPIAAFLKSPDRARLERNLDIARAHFNVDALGERLSALLASAGIRSDY
jgi:glycosyltransferase involved in cell wall biosynthesis